MTTKVKVAVRVRPMNKREISLGCECVVHMAGEQTNLLGSDTIKNLNANRAEKKFTFDHSFWSFSKDDSHFADQSIVFEALGTDVLKNAFEGYNACIFAYGQTGSGKSYTMMGAEGDKGIIPRLCESLFDTIDENTDANLTFKVEVSYMEIYNEKVRDLLGAIDKKKSLRVREHKILGPYVEGLTKVAVKDFDTIQQLMDDGNQSRTVAATNMNAESSRSHAVFNMIVTQEMYDPLSKHKAQKVSRISLVDLAGSERAGKTGAEGKRLREGANINKSLTTLGLVIANLADISSGKKKGTGFVPYRDSILTWLLKDNLGGNAKTVMVATISPAIDNYEETLSTLRYADRAKRIENHAIVNEDPSAKLIRQLREEIDRLKGEMGTGGMHGGADDGVADAELLARLQENEQLMKEMELSWEEKLKLAEQQRLERQKAFESLGIRVSSQGVAIDKEKYYFVNLNEDPTLAGMLVYHLEPPITVIGSIKSNDHHSIVLQGAGVREDHAHVTIDPKTGHLYIVGRNGGKLIVNGRDLSGESEPIRLRHGTRLLVGPQFFFRVVCPHKPGEEEKQKKEDWESANAEMLMGDSSASEMLQQLPDKEREILQESMQRALTDIRSANEITKELSLPYYFDMKLRLSDTALQYPTGDSGPRSELAVELHHTTSKFTHTSTLDRFVRSTLPTLQEAYESGVMREYDLIQTTMDLLGVGHIFLKGLAHGMKARFRIPVISKGGETCCELVVVVQTYPQIEMDAEEVTSLSVGDQLRLLIVIEKAVGVPSDFKMLAICLDASQIFDVSEPQMCPSKTNADDGTSQRGTHNFYIDYLVSVTITKEILHRLATRCITLKVDGFNESVLEFQRQMERSALGSNSITPEHGFSNGTPADMAPIVKKWLPHIGYYKLWVEFLEANDEGEFRPVYANFPDATPTGCQYRLRQGSACQVRATLTWLKGTKPTFTGVQSVQLSDVAVFPKGNIVPNSDTSTDLESLLGHYDHNLAEFYGVTALESELRSTLDDSTDGDAVLDSTLMEKKKAYLQERRLVREHHMDLSLPGSYQTMLRDRHGDNSKAFEECMVVGYLPYTFTENQREQQADAVSLAVSDVSVKGDAITVIASWNIPPNLKHLHSVTGDSSRVSAKLTFAFTAEGTPHPLVVEKYVTFKIVSRKSSFKPSLIERLKGGFTKNLPKGCGLNIQLIDDVPSFRRVDQAMANENVTESFHDRAKQLKNVVEINQLEVKMHFDRLRKQMQARSINSYLPPKAAFPATQQQTPEELMVQYMQRRKQLAQRSGDQDLLIFITNNEVLPLQKVLDGTIEDWEDIDFPDTLSDVSSVHTGVDGDDDEDDSGDDDMFADEQQPNTPRQLSRKPTRTSTRHTIFDDDDDDEDDDSLKLFNSIAHTSVSQNSDEDGNVVVDLNTTLTEESLVDGDSDGDTNDAHSTDRTEERKPKSPHHANDGDDDGDGDDGDGSSHSREEDGKVEQQEGVESNEDESATPLATSADTKATLEGSHVNSVAVAVDEEIAEEEGEAPSQDLDADTISPSQRLQQPSSPNNVRRKLPLTPPMRKKMLDEQASERPAVPAQDGGNSDDNDSNSDNDSSVNKGKVDEVESVGEGKKNATEPSMDEHGEQASTPKKAEAKVVRRGVKSSAAPAQASSSSTTPRSESAKKKEKASSTRKSPSSQKTAASKPKKTADASSPSPSPSSTSSRRSSTATVKPRGSSGHQATPRKSLTGSSAKKASTPAAKAPRTRPTSSSKAATPASKSASGGKKRKGKKATKWQAVTAMPKVHYNVGDEVYIENKTLGTSRGIVHFMGMVSFGEGPWVGVELLERPGKHDGTKEGVRYFTCPDGSGMFVRPDKVKPMSSSK